MRTFYIASALFVLLIVWLLNKPIAHQRQVAREFTDSEIAYLEKSFDYAMDMLKPGEHMDWSVAAVNGRVSAGKEYTSTQKANCRQYVEISRTYEAQKVDSGIACKRVGKDGWCRIHGTNPPSCALEITESTLKKRSRFAILRGTQIIDDLLGTSIGVDSNSLMPSAPRVHADIPSVGRPSISKPDIEPGDLRPPMPWDPGEQNR